MKRSMENRGFDPDGTGWFGRIKPKLEIKQERLRGPLLCGKQGQLSAKEEALS